MKLMFITNNSEIAAEAHLAGIDRIFVDLEILGKIERQGHLNTVISYHTMEDISKIRKVIKDSELLVRVNPIHEGSSEEINEVISRGADVVMLPMFKTAQEADYFVRCVGGRAKTCLLLETAQAFTRIDQILEIKGIDEIYIGLNDLHLSMHLDFMFEPLSSGIVEYICKKVKAKGIKYGFGGIANLGKGMLPAELILAEHYRLGSEMVILSRAFYDGSKTSNNLKDKNPFSEGIMKIRNYEEELRNWTEIQFSINRRKLCEIVEEIVLKKISR
jgi:2-keto-3-deoxy-L-rhamnonate aldolase RhmA